MELKCQAKYVQPLYEAMCSRAGGVINIKEYKFVQQCDSMKSINLVKPHENIVLLEFYPGTSVYRNSLLVIYRPESMGEAGHLIADLPTILIDNSDIIKSGAYNDFGIYTPAKEAVKKISIQRVKNNYFKNNKTQKDTSFLLQSERISECYESEIQTLLSN